MRMTLPPEWPVSTMWWAFAASSSGRTWPMCGHLAAGEAVAAVRDRYGTGTAAA
jgi:hypothetical protein